MTPSDLHRFRVRLGQTLGRPVSLRDLGLALRLSPFTAQDTVRSWEDGSKTITGPASVACDLIDEIMHGSGGVPEDCKAFVVSLFDPPPPKR